MMSKGDSTYSSGSWVGNLYQKFEAVCQEVDDIVTHEHMKNLENHVQLCGDNVMKFCSNVRDLIPSSFRAPVKHVAESVNCIVELEDGDGECPSLSDGIHSEDNLQNPFFSGSRSLPSGLKLVQSGTFLVKHDEDSRFEEEKKSSELSGIFFTDGYFLDQGSEKKTPFDASELTCHEGSFITETSDSFTLNEEESTSNMPDEDPCEDEKQSSEISEKQSTFDGSELSCHKSTLITENSDSFTTKTLIYSDCHESSLSNAPELAFPDEDPCELSTASIFHNEHHEPGDKLSFGVSPSAYEDKSGSEIHQKEETVHDNMIRDSIHENNPRSEFQLKEVVLDSLSKSFFNISIESAPYSLLASSITFLDSETSAMRLASSISSPVVHFSNHHAVEFHRTEGPSYSDTAVKLGSTSTCALAFQSSEPFSCISSPKEDTGDLGSSSWPSSSSLEFTEIPTISVDDNGGLELKQSDIPVISPAVDKCWLRKKKIRSPFSSRKKLEKEYKQLAIWYCDIDAEFNKVPEENAVSSSQSRHQAAQDLQESDWEIL